MIELLGLCGSMRAASTNSALLAALALNAPIGCRLTVHDGLARLPIFNPDDEGERTPPEVRRLVQAVAHADGLVISCPEYAHGVPGGLKNALDWLVSTDAAVGKPAMLVHASTRSAISRAALIEILKTMSFDLAPEPQLEMPLLGKKGGDVAEMLGQASNVAAMRETLEAFVSVISNR